MRRVSDVNSSSDKGKGKAGLSDKGKGKAIEDGEEGDDVLPPGLETWVKRGQEEFDEKRQLMGEKAFHWLFMSELWPKQTTE